jgi:nitroreductase
VSKRDGSLTLHGRVTPLMDLFLRRRSVRKYSEGQATEEQVAYLLACADRFQQRAGFSAPWLAVVPRGPEFDAVLRAATAGLIGKTNPWLPFTKAGHLVLCGTRYPEPAERAGVELAIKQAAMVMQVAILAAAELGLATCWMAGINHEQVELSYTLPDGARLIAISTLGLPPRRMGLSWDAAAYHLVSKRRKPLEALWLEERWREGR